MSRVRMLSKIVDASYAYKKAALRYARSPDAERAEVLERCHNILSELVGDEGLAFADEILADAADQRLPDLYGVSQRMAAEILRTEYAASSTVGLGKAITRREVERVISLEVAEQVDLPKSRQEMVAMVLAEHTKIVAAGRSKAQKTGKKRSAETRRLIRRCLGGVFGAAFLLCNTITRQLQYSAGIAEAFLRDAQRT